MVSTRAASQYAKVGVASQASSASPTRIILMLLDGALAKMGTGAAAIKGGDAKARAVNLNKAIDIVAALRASLDHEKGGKLAKNLSNVYQFVELSLIKVIATKDLALLEECRNNLSTIREGWVEVVNQYDKPGAA